MLQWWIDHIKDSYKNISCDAPLIVVYTDASGEISGAHDKSNNLPTNG